jgi:DNA (cytosine-5)-methyltransferase 1
VKVLKAKKKVSDEKPMAIDLFCGCGGLTLGLRKAGFRVVAAVEVDPLAVKTYKDNHPGVFVLGEDIRTVKIEDLKKRLALRKGALSLLAGCPPCQGFSTMRTLNGAREIEDPRNDLLSQFLRFVEVLRPKAVMLENVPGLAKDARFSAFCERMKELEYLGDYKVLNVADYGVPQRRFRLIYLAGFRHTIPFGNSCKRRRTVRDAIEKLPKVGSSGDPVHDQVENRTQRIMELIRRIPKDGGNRTDLPRESQLACHKRCDGFKDVYGRMAWDKVAPTITSGCFNPSKGRFLHPEEDRAITMREAALLQGFPQHYKLPGDNKSAVALMIGNALPPPFVKRHAQSVHRVLQKKKTKE